MRMFDFTRTITVPSKFCCYCGRKLDKKVRTKDHIIARKFVPQGTLENEFNLQIFCCAKCNGIKSKLEDDLSAITMLPDLSGKFARDDERLFKTARRKAIGSVSWATKKKVADSHSKLKVNANLGHGMKMAFDFTGQPHVDRRRIELLAWFQIQGFFFFRSFNKQVGFGSYIPRDKFFLADYMRREDWGNPTLTSFAQRTEGWEPLLHLVMADGYIRASEKKCDSGLRCWALEWNEAYRCFGVWGDKQRCEEFIASLEEPKVDMMDGDKINGWGCRIDTPIAEDKDILFQAPQGLDELDISTEPHWK